VRPPERDRPRPAEYRSGVNVEMVSTTNDRTQSTSMGKQLQAPKISVAASCIGAALAYAERGWPVLPVIGKTPALKNWPTAATTDPDVIVRWFMAHEDRNIGIVTGPRSGLAVLDLDPGSGSYESLCELEQRVGVLPGTVMSRTGGGGLHLVYGHPGLKLTSRAHAFGPGIDVRADGGMIVAPPSVHPDTGRTYEWFGDVSDGIVPWPAALLPQVPEPRSPSWQRQPSSYGEGSNAVRRRLAAVLGVLGDAVEGERNARLHWAACRCAEMVAAGELNEATATAALMRAAGAVGLGRGEAQQTVRSGLRRVGAV